MNRKLTYINQGRGGTVVYSDEKGEIKFDWEFGGGDCVAIIFVPGTANWHQATGRPVEDRLPVLTFVAEQAIIDQSPQGKSVISDQFIELWKSDAKEINQQVASTAEVPQEYDKLLQKRIKQISMILFVLSLTQKAYCTTTSCSDSIMVFLLGWAAIFSTGAGICWFANPLLFVSWFLLEKNLKIAMFLSMTSTLLAFFFLMFSSIVDNEGAIPHPIISYNAGYWLWVCSTVTMLIGTYVLMYRHNVRNKTVARVRHF